MKPECGKKIYDLIDDELLEKLIPIRYSQEVTKKLFNDGHQLYIVTATQPQFVQTKAKWLQHYFPWIDLRNLIISHDKWLVHTDVLIDDSPKNIKGFRGAPIVCDYPWNRDVRRVYRANNWHDIYRIIKGMSAYGTTNV